MVDPDLLDQGPWFVRAADNKVSVGIFACHELMLARYIDEICDADGCEYKRLAPGGFFFGGEVVLDRLDPEADDFEEHLKTRLTESWMPVYDEDGPWHQVDVEALEC